MKTVAIILFLSASHVLGAQDSITLFECHRQAVENAPRLKDRDLILETGALNVEQAKTAWYPSLDVNGKVSYQSDVVTVALTDPTIPVAFPEVPHDQYGLNLDIRQTLYDGGVSKQKRALEQAKTAANLQEVEVDMHSLKSRVNQFYFTILILQENRKNLEIHLINLQTREESMTSAIQNGILLENELKVIEVEKLRIRQSMVEVDARKKSFLDALNVWCGTAYTRDDILEIPQLKAVDPDQVNRPEYTLFELRDASMEAGKEMLGKKRMPVVYAYGQTGYGKPGYNMMSGQWDFYYMLGAGLKWNIWDWSSSSREKQLIENQQKLLQNKRATFDKEIGSKLVQEEARMDQYRQTMELEVQVLQLREEISAHAATKLSNGTITATEYISELNKESLARISLATHEILLKQSITNYLTIQGNL